MFPSYVISVIYSLQFHKIMELIAWESFNTMDFGYFWTLFLSRIFLKTNQKQKFHRRVDESAASVLEVGLRLQNHFYDDFLSSFIPSPTLLHSLGYLRSFQNFEK